jgi:hypothetical protein
VIASYQSNVAGGSLVAFDEKPLTLSGTAANLVVAAGDVLVLDETVTGTGVAHSGYRVEVDIARTTTGRRSSVALWLPVRLPFAGASGPSRGSPSAFFALREKWRPWWFPQPVAPDPPDSDLTN